MQAEDRTRILAILGGIVAAIAGFALLFWAISYFVPRFLHAAGDARVRIIFIFAMAIIVLFNVFRRHRSRKAAVKKVR